MHLIFSERIANGNYGNDDVKVRVHRQNGVLKDYLPRHSFCSQYSFSNSVNDKSHEDTDTRTYYFHVKFKNLQQSGSQCM